MFLALALTSLLALSNACVYRREEHHTLWGYRGHVYEGSSEFLLPKDWHHGYPACDGANGDQSPINIRASEAVTQTGYANFNHGKIASTLDISNNGHTFVVGGHGQLSGFTIAGADLGSRKFVADAFHLHWDKAGTILGSEHRINGKASALELHVVHYDASFPSLGAAVASGQPGVLAVAGFLIDADATTDNAVFAPLSNALLNGAADYPKTTSVSGFDLRAFVASAKDNGFFRYNGSLTTPTCNPIVNWFVFNTRLHISPAQAQAFYDIKGEEVELHGTTHVDSVGPNWRPVQPLGDRTVLWYPRNKCGSSCAACSSDSTCSACKDGFTLSPITLGLCVYCPDGFHGVDCTEPYTYTYSFQGTVTNPKGSAIAGVKIRVGDVVRAVTDASGRYTIEGVLVPNSKQLDFSAAKKGYVTSRATKRVGSDNTLRVDFVLAREQSP